MTHPRTPSPAPAPAPRKLPAPRPLRTIGTCDTTRTLRTTSAARLCGTM